MLWFLFYYSPHRLIVGLFQRVLNHSCLPQHEALMWVDALGKHKAVRDAGESLGRSFSAVSFILPMLIST